MNRKEIATAATVAALRLRAEMNHPLEWPICPYQIARRLGITVCFQPLPSLEGMYSPDGPTIVLGSLRPRARRAFTCGHELGHHVMGHGLRVDHVNQVDADNDNGRGVDPAEFSAQRFSGALLMPKLAVEHAFVARGWSAGSCNPTQAYTVAGCLGVGYETLLLHMRMTLRIISADHADALRRPLPRIRKQILGFDPPRDLIVVDEQWRGRDVEAEVDDLLLLPKGAVVDGAAVCGEAHDGALLFRAVAPGRATARTTGWAVSIGIARREYGGFDLNRHKEDPEYGT